MGQTKHEANPLGSKNKLDPKALLDLYERLDASPVGTTLLNIAVGMGISRPTLYRYINRRATLEPLARSEIAKEVARLATSPQHRA